MSKYIDIVLTANGRFCLASSWVVNEGDFVNLRNAVTGENEIVEVVAVSTDKLDGAHITMIEKYVGYPLPRITEKYTKTEVKWDAPIQE